jgi:dethiobiotin synthetase
MILPYLGWASTQLDLFSTYFEGRKSNDLKPNDRGCFVTAIHTDSGKTLASAIITQALKADYWKPIQCGEPTDSNQIRAFLGPDTKIHTERYCLRTPASPHFAAKQEGLNIEINDFALPETENFIVTEGAGGLLVPLNQKQTIADLATHLALPVVLVINHYLGALNHSLLTLSELEHRGLPVHGLIFNGPDFQEAEPILLAKAQAPCLLRIPHLPFVDIKQIAALAATLVWK